MTDDIRSELHDSVDAAVDAQTEKDAAEARLRAIEDRLNQPSPQPDLSGYVTREDLDSKFSELTTLIGGLVAPPPAPPAASTETTIDDDDDDEEEEAPKVVTQMTTKAEIEERPPRSSHFLFRRIGR